MEEESGDEDTQHEDRESDDQNKWLKINGRVAPDQPGHITHRGESDVDVSEFLTETDTGVFTTKVESGERKKGHRGEDNEGGMSVEDLQRGFISEVQSREQREEELGQK